MKVFKFGGASIKSAKAIRNMAGIVKKYADQPLVLVVSAMGKTTNALEDLIRASLNGENYQTNFNLLKEYHVTIAEELCNSDELKKELNNWFEQLKLILQLNSKPSYSKYYDSVVSTGEMLSSTIINYCLNDLGINSVWLDARRVIKTDSTFQDAKVDWDKTCDNIKHYIANSNNQIFLTQGFIGSTNSNETSTLGREGSDYTAAIFASCLQAESVTIWKDVPGILNADPKIIDDAILFEELSYKEASEMTFYGAKVIHPRTIKPLANKNIPLHVRCFDDPDKKGTIIHECEMEDMPTVVIYKENQCLISFKAKDFSFINEDAMSTLFKAFHKLDLSIHIMQNSAISFSVCTDFHQQKVHYLIELLSNEFEILYNSNLQLVTIKNYNQETLKKYKPKSPVLLEQISRNNYRVLVTSK